MTKANYKEIKIIQLDYGSILYQKSLEFRDKILRQPLGLELSRKDLKDEDQQLHIAAIYDNKIVGTVVLKPSSKLKARLRQMAVDDICQGRGIGKKLVNFAENLAKEKGFQEIEMTARVSALGFYDKLGYKTQGEEFEEVTIKAIRMIKSLV